MDCIVGYMQSSLINHVGVSFEIARQRRDIESLRTRGNLDTGREAAKGMLLEHAVP